MLIILLFLYYYFKRFIILIIFIRFIIIFYYSLEIIISYFNNNVIIIEKIENIKSNDILSLLFNFLIINNINNIFKILYNYLEKNKKKISIYIFIPFIFTFIFEIAYSFLIIFIIFIKSLFTWDIRPIIKFRYYLLNIIDDNDDCIIYINKEKIWINGRFSLRFFFQKSYDCYTYKTNVNNKSNHIIKHKMMRFHENTFINFTSKSVTKINNVEHKNIELPKMSDKKQYCNIVKFDILNDKKVFEDKNPFDKKLLSIAIYYVINNLKNNNNSEIISVNKNNFSRLENVNNKIFNDGINKWNQNYPIVLYKNNSSEDKNNSSE